ncbi:SseB family protein [Streptomyces sp. WMMC500]|uniref:SseB family protein n=1 Tax=Streptomyces sp. WMMC500 TaxID=3015154 RepID=UPI00248D0B38|nr:SseB family protein [Streptomyces sp. WMMC500]WBB59532.1 SseB family protein [Streptomyces sp. WMMC500]
MTEAPQGNDPSTTQRALEALATDAKDPAALHALAHSEVLVPVPDERPDLPEGSAEEEPPGAEESMMLPVMEQPNGDRLVPVFTSESRMGNALPSVDKYRKLPLVLLANAWPSDEVSLTIDTGSPGALTLSAAGVRTLLGRSGG